MPYPPERIVKGVVDLDYLSRLAKAFDRAAAESHRKSLEVYLPAWAKSKDYQTTGLLYTKMDGEVGFHGVKWEVPIAFGKGGIVYAQVIVHPTLSSKPVIMGPGFRVEMREGAEQRRAKGSAPSKRSTG